MSGAGAGVISVIVPTLDEGGTVAACLEAARARLGACELIVVDGSPDGRTRAAAEQAGATVIELPGSRAVAMNAGAAAALGDVLLFLHADTRLPEGAGTAIRSLLTDADGGAFRLRFDERRRGLELLSWARERLARQVYGDQAIFVSRSAFERLGGYRELPIMEDHDLVRRLRRAGRFRLAPLAVVTSTRRHRAHGSVRTILRIWRIQWLYRLGVSPERLARSYRPAR